MVNNAKSVDDRTAIEASVNFISSLTGTGQVAHFPVPVHTNSSTVAAACPSCDHGNALNAAVRHLCALQHGGPVVPLTQFDVLWLLDADMILLSDVHLLISAQRKPQWHILTTLRHAINPTTNADAPYLWPNFCLFTGIPIAVLAKIDFYPGFMDSGSRSFELLRNPTLRVLDAPSSYYNPRAITAEDEAVMCRFPSASAAAVPPHCVFIQQQSDVLVEASCASYSVIVIPLAAASRPALVYHLGSAASNWRSCSEPYLTARAEDMFAFLAASFESNNKSAALSLLRAIAR